MERRRRQARDASEVKPFDVDGVRAVAVGTVLWAAAFLVLAVRRTSLEAADRGWWLWTALAGVGLGLVGLEYCRKRRDAIALAQLEEEAGLDDHLDGIGLVSEQDEAEQLAEQPPPSGQTEVPPLPADRPAPGHEPQYADGYGPPIGPTDYDESAYDTGHDDAAGYYDTGHDYATGHDLPHAGPPVPADPYGQPVPGPPTDLYAQPDPNRYPDEYSPPDQNQHPGKYAQPDRFQQSDPYADAGEFAPAGYAEPPTDHERAADAETGSGADQSSADDWDDDLLLPDYDRGQFGPVGGGGRARHRARPEGQPEESAPEDSAEFRATGRRRARRRS